MSTERDALIVRARKLRSEISQMFSDAEHWNNSHPSELPIDPDPDGKLKRLAAGLDRMLAPKLSVVQKEINDV